MNLNQITIPVLDVEKSIAFYKTLGLKLIVQSLPHYACFFCEDGVVTFYLHQLTQLPTGEGVWVYFELNNLDDTILDLQQKGIVFEELPTDQPWLWTEARLKDLDNNQIILYFAGKSRLNPPWKIVE